MDAVNHNVREFPTRPIYKKMLERVEKDFGFEGAMINSHLLTNSEGLIITGLHFTDRYQMASGEDYEKILTCVNMYIYFNDIARIVDVNIIRYDKEYSHFQSFKDSWDSRKIEHKFERILNAQPWVENSVIDDVRLYLIKLYDLGFRLFQNEPLCDNVKKFFVFKENIIVEIMIDYNALTSLAEIFEMEMEGD